MPSFWGEVGGPVFEVAQPQPASAPAFPALIVEEDPAPGTAPFASRLGLRADLDSDGDGIADAVDECTATPPGIAVDAFGCPVPLYMKLQVTFGTNQTMVDEQSLDRLQRIGRLLQQNPQSTVVVEGHTDDVGSAENNLQLSRQRAEGIKQQLVQEFGIQAERVTAVGYGPDRPLVSNATESGRSRNRRVELVLNGYYRSETSYIALYRPYNIPFEVAQTEIGGAFQRKVDDLGAYLRDHPGTRAVIAGHTDNVGSTEGNLILSIQRAEAVKRYLEERYALGPERLRAEGHGDRKPLADNASEEGRSLNRRVTVTVSPDPQQHNPARFPSRMPQGRLDTTSYEPLEQRYTLRFKAQTGDLDRPSRQQVDALGLMLQQRPELSMVIAAQTLQTQTTSGDPDLLRRRANAVQRYLMAAYAIPAERLQLAASGSESALEATDHDGLQISVGRF